MRITTLILFLIATLSLSGQEKKIKLLSADISTVDETRYPDAIILIGNVKMEHEGAFLDCQRAILYREKNIFNAVGNVILEQGDSIIQYSDFAYYDGDKKIAKSWGNVQANDKTITLTTDTLYFNRVKQFAHYPTKGIIKDKENTIISNSGTYFFRNKRFIAKSNVEITNPENIINSKKLDYYSETKLSYLYGPTTIINKKDSTKIYSEKGFYDTTKKISYFVKNTKITMNNGRTIEADSLYYDELIGFASATNNIKVTDTINDMVTKGNYAEIFEKKDSLFITKKAVNIKLMDKDSIFVHGDTIMVTGKPKARIITTFHNVTLFKSDLQGRCDSIKSLESTGLTTMYRKPVLWSSDSQITGDTIKFLVDVKTKKLDSLFIIKNSFMIQQDTIDKSLFNQIKGRDMLGKFKKNSLKDLFVKGNAQSQYYHRNETSTVLETITEMMASGIEFSFKDKSIEQIKYLTDSEGKTYPPSKFPKDKNKLKGFVWREEQQPKTKHDLFMPPLKFPKEEKKETKKNQKGKTPVPNELTKEKNINKAKNKFKELEKINSDRLKEAPPSISLPLGVSKDLKIPPPPSPILNEGINTSKDSLENNNQPKKTILKLPQYDINKNE